MNCYFFIQASALPAPWKCSEEFFSHQIKNRDPLKIGFPNIWALRLVRELLQWNPEDRPSVDEALKHPYFSQRDRDSLHREEGRGRKSIVLGQPKKGFCLRRTIGLLDLNKRVWVGHKTGHVPSDPGKAGEEVLEEPVTFILDLNKNKGPQLTMLPSWMNELPDSGVTRDAREGLMMYLCLIMLAQRLEWLWRYLQARLALMVVFLRTLDKVPLGFVNGWSSVQDRETQVFPKKLRGFYREREREKVSIFQCAVVGKDHFGFFLIDSLARVDAEAMKHIPNGGTIVFSGFGNQS
ncbi:putative inactive protein kinase [Capsicum chinense]|nr:putative inactive protein kinase [Capsicum chinense]